MTLNFNKGQVGFLWVCYLKCRSSAHCNASVIQVNVVQPIERSLLNLKSASVHLKRLSCLS